MDDSERHQEYLDLLPIGEEIPFDAAEIPGWEIFPFTGDLQVVPLEPPVLPEPDRSGEGDRRCVSCDVSADSIVWSNDDWVVSHLGEPSAVPVFVMLRPHEHHDLDDLPPTLVASMGSMLQRLAAAVEQVPGVARAHLNKWGDGGAHLHWFAIGRPAGMRQLRGSCLVIWDDVLPKIPTEMWRRNLRVVADHLDSGEA